jgi:HEAT repeat protein
LAAGWLLAAALVTGSAEAADPPAAPGAAGPVAVANGRLTLDVHDADLTQLLSEIARRAGFQLTASGSLGRVTATLNAVPVDRALQRLTREHELVLVYRPDDQVREPALAHVRVFAAGSPRGTAGAEVGARDDPSGATAIAEINQLVRTRNTEQGVARLGELLDGSSDPRVRARAAWALGRLGGANAVDLLSRAVRDDSVDVRLQAAQALGQAGGDHALPALASLLQNDPDASVRRAVAGFLGTSKDPVAASALMAAANDADQSVRDEANRGLERHRATAK